MPANAQNHMTVLGDLIRANAARFPDKTGLVCGDVRLTWRQVNERVNRLANAIAGFGLSKGDRFAILELNCHRYVELYFALAKLGVVAVPLNHRLAGPELAFMVNQSGARAVCVRAEFAPVIEPMRPKLETVEVVIGAGDGHGCGLDYEELIAGHPDAEPEVDVNEGDLLRIVYTGGTTGLPKGVMLSHRSAMSYALTMQASHRVVPSDVYAVFPGLSLVGAPVLAYGYMLLGCTIIPAVFEPQRAIELIERERVTACLFTPTMLIMMFERSDYGRRDLSSMRLLEYGASPMPLPVLNGASGKFVV